VSRRPTDADELLFAYRRARQRLLEERPRVSWCAFTRKYVLVRNGGKHVCNRSWKTDEAFRHLSDAMDEGRRYVAERLKALAKTYGQPPE